MAIGHKTGGRTTGTPNRKTQDIGELLDALGCNPIEGMAKIAENAANPPELRGRMYAELAGYVFPKRKALEHSGAGGSSIQLVVMAAGQTLDEPRAQMLDIRSLIQED